MVFVHADIKGITEISHFSSHSVRVGYYGAARGISYIRIRATLADVTSPLQFSTCAKLAVIIGYSNSCDLCTKSNEERLVPQKIHV